MSSELTLLFVHGSALGYGRLGVELDKALRARGVDVYDHLDSPDLPEGLGEKMLNEGRRAKRTNVVCWVSVPTHARGWWKGQHSSVFTMWEATRLPETFRETLHEFDTVVVPSDQNLELFSQYHPNVRLAYLGVDPEVWGFRPRTPPEREFRFLVGGSGKRKGTDLAHAAFRKVFPSVSVNPDGSVGPPWWKDGPTPVLVMKNPKGEDYYGERVEMVTGRISSRDEVDLYASAHCYLQPSRGEGFGLQPLQAIAQGCPTILTNAHGHAAFAHLGIGIGSKPAPADYFIYGDAGEWWEPDFDELCERMVWVYKTYEHRARDARLNAWNAVNHESARFTWNHTAEQFVAAFDGALDLPPTGTQEWFRPDVKRFLVMVNEPWSADIAGVTYHFMPGQRYYELSDVKRILFEAGKLDPACIATIGPDGNIEDFDHGLTQSQAERIPDYTAAHAHCNLCGQRLGTAPTRADDLLAARS